MKKILFALILSVQSLIGAEALAAACAPGNLAAYIGLGGTGCTIGKVRFSDFALLPQIANSAPFQLIAVAPFTMGATTVGLTFGVNATDAAGGLFLDNLISYRVTGVGASLTSASLFITGSSTAGDAAVTVIENLCIAGLFLGADGVSGCSGTPLDQTVVDTVDFAVPATSLAFASAASLAVVTDIGVDGGTVTDGVASLVSASNGFTFAPNAVPEPASLLLIAAGLFALFGYRAVLPVRVSRFV